MQKDHSHLSISENLYRWCGIINDKGFVNSERSNLICPKKARTIEEKIKHCEKCAEFTLQNTVDKPIEAPPYILQNAMNKVKERGSAEPKKKLVPVLFSTAATFMIVASLFLFSGTSGSQIHYQISGSQVSEDTLVSASGGEKVLQVMNDKNISAEILLSDQSQIQVGNIEKAAVEENINLTVKKGSVEVKLFGSYQNQSLNLFIGEYFIKSKWVPEAKASMLGDNSLLQENKKPAQNHFQVKLDDEGEYEINVIAGKVFLHEVKNYGNAEKNEGFKLEKGETVIIKKSGITAKNITENEPPGHIEKIARPEKKQAVKKLPEIDENIKSTIDKAIRIKNRREQQDK